MGEVWSARTVKSNRCFVYVFAADLPEQWAMKPSDVGLDDDKVYRAFESSTPEVVLEFSSGQPLVLQVS